MDPKPESDTDPWGDLAAEFAVRGLGDEWMTKARAQFTPCAVVATPADSNVVFVCKCDPTRGFSAAGLRALYERERASQQFNRWFAKGYAEGYAEARKRRHLDRGEGYLEGYAAAAAAARAAPEQGLRQRYAVFETDQSDQ